MEYKFVINAQESSISLFRSPLDSNLYSVLHTLKWTISHMKDVRLVLSTGTEVRVAVSGFPSVLSAVLLVSPVLS